MMGEGVNVDVDEVSIAGEGIGGASGPCGAAVARGGVDIEANESRRWGFEGF